ncbi:SpoIIE family protein phosphatase [Pseudomonas sp. RIT-PI-S]|uniref:SpoIIE family protein phosphatase n=1 Tax=Pseudomonas sp. RIT-PI-S TaxID=3035295 RepID=UPI0021D885CD|nr:SpoIIE family protein phosphatase [Pseudomonas sp. RIT-PI-S]
MEVDSRVCSLVIPVGDLAHVDAARRAIVRQASQLTDDEERLGKLTIVVQELGRNLVLHAGHGQLIYRQGPDSISLLAVDSGPGMANVGQCLADHYSSIGTMGVGLGSVRRLADQFDIFSQPEQGTVVFAGFELAPPSTGLRHGAVCVPYPGENVAGDAWAVVGNRVMICDGLGHGHAASAASTRAREVFEEHDARHSLEQLMDKLHRALMPTRGGAVGIAEIKPETRQVLYCGMGNIAGLVLGEKNRGMVSSNGTVGYRIGRIHTFSYPWDPGSVLIMTSDGIKTRLDTDSYPGLRVRHPEVIAGLLHRDFHRQNDDSTVVVARID